MYMQASIKLYYNHQPYQNCSKELGTCKPGKRSINILMGVIPSSEHRRASNPFLCDRIAMTQAA